MENTIKEHELLAKHEANIEEIFHQLGEVKAEVRDIRKADVGRWRNWRRKRRR